MNDLKFDSMLAEELIISDLDVRNSSELFKYVSEVLVEKGYVTNDYGEHLIEREKEFPTGLATKSIDVAIPHTDAMYVKTPFIFIVKTKSNIDFHQMGSVVKDNIIVHPRLVFILGFNRDEMQLKLLQVLMNVFNDQEVMTNVTKSDSKKQIYTILSEKLREVGSEKA
ncbi:MULTISPECIES: PTS sugar transporter subunit IIA [Lactobacillaceae]|uniref:PTS sugar transporter subunit IIA n=1 Tax=Lactobacillaceae TaxID=33958 RepID=UPI001CDAF9B0|nr:PTS sugar transporter subunit IIA [Lacticaseibacillus paracasei]MDM7549880.1 PTS sugar transporter subunit IIA [Lacticaseibacillus paracasei]